MAETAPLLLEVLEKAADQPRRLGPGARGSRTLAEGLRWFVAGMAAGRIRPKRRKHYKPNTIDSGANPKAIQEFMGHAKIHTTVDVYGHLLPGSHDEVRRRMDAYLRSES